MANFNVSFLRPGAAKGSGGGSGYGVLVDQLSILENQLKLDGKLAPGDYDVLIKASQNLASNPGLTNDQRSNIRVKISGYETAKSTGALTANNDIPRMNRDTEDDDRRLTKSFANDPATFLKGKLESARLKLNDLAEAADNLTGSEDDASAHLNEYNATLSDYKDLQQAYDDVLASTGKDKPSSNFSAYITTNSKGEIRDMKIGRAGQFTGYAETNGLYGGLKIYGKVNRKDEGGNNVFQLGDTSFSAPDYLQADPQNPSATRPQMLMSEEGFETSEGGRTRAQAGTYKVVDPKMLRTQQSVEIGGWARGIDGTLYKRNDSGKYTKYLNIDPSVLGVEEKNLLRVPSQDESDINAQSEKTIDASSDEIFNTASLSLPGSMTPGGFSTEAGPSVVPAATQQEQLSRVGTGRSNAVAPTDRAPSTSQGIVEKTKNAARSLLNYVRGR